MSQKETQGTPQEEKSKPEEVEDKRKLVVFTVLFFLLILLLAIAAITYSTLYTVFAPKVKFIILNRECLQCHLEMLPKLQQAYVHSPFLTKKCTSCHTPHQTKTVPLGKLKTRKRCGCILGSAVSALPGKKPRPKGLGKAGLVSPQEKLCSVCHRFIGKGEDRYKHRPFKEGFCADCHNPHASNYASLAKVAHDKLCLACHPIGSELNLAQVHPPFEKGYCMDCHVPHQSAVKGLLTESQKTLCLACHQSIARLTGMPVQHSPFDNGQCTGCHKPHSSNYTPLLIESQPPLCYQCHPEIRLDFLKPSHHPVGVSPALNCSSCHQPHAAFYAKLLIAENNNLCYLCHEDKRFYYEKCAHNEVAYLSGIGLCIMCHTPHGSYYAPLLLQEELSLCYSCHQWKKPLAHQHPVGRPYRDERVGKRLTCTSTCHDPHGTAYPYMANKPKDALCLICHQVRELP